MTQKYMRGEVVVAIVDDGERKIRLVKLSNVRYSARDIETDEKLPDWLILRAEVCDVHGICVAARTPDLDS